MLVEERRVGDLGGGAYAFEGGFGGQAGFGIVLAADGRCESNC